MNKTASIIISVNKVFLIFTLTLFFTFGKGYHNSKIFVIFNVLLLLYSFVNIIYVLKNEKNLLNKNLLLIVFFIILFTVSQIISLYRFGITSKSMYYFYWCVFCIDSAFWGYYLSYNIDNNDLFINLKKSFLLIVYVCILALFFNWVQSMRRNEILKNANLSYQKMGYFLAFSYTLILYFYFFNKDKFKKQYKILINKYLLSFILYLLPIMIISYRARGPFLLIAFSSFFSILLNLFMKNNHYRIKKLVIYFLINFLVIASLFFLTNKNRLVMNGINRIFPISTITKILNVEKSPLEKSTLEKSTLEKSTLEKSTLEKSTLEKSTLERIDAISTDRGSIYIESINAIKEQVFLGYGFFSYKYVYTRHHHYPHNLFLEFALQGGIFYLLIMIFVIFYCVRNFVINLFNSNVLFIAYIAIYPIINLLVSETYLRNSYYWFVLFFFLNLQQKKLKK